MPWPECDGDGYGNGGFLGGSGGAWLDCGVPGIEPGGMGAGLLGLGISIPGYRPPPLPTLLILPRLPLGPILKKKIKKTLVV